MTTHATEPIHSNLDRSIALEVKVWLLRKDKSQIWLSELLGITQAGVSRRIKGITPFTMRELLTTANALGLTLSQLLGEDIADTKNPRLHQEDGDLSVATPGLDPGTSRL